jgi:hypothetical protein
VTNTLLTPSEITMEALRLFENNLTAAKHVNKQYSSAFAKEGAKIGASLNVRKPVRYTVTMGSELEIQDATETFATIVLDKQAHIGMTFSSVDLTLSIDQFSERFIAPAAVALANQVDADVLALYYKFYQAVGTPGTVPATALVILQAKAKLENSATPMSPVRSLVVDPTTEITVVDALKGLFQQSTAIAQQYAKGSMGTALGFNWYMDQNVKAHTVGTYGGSPIVAGAGQTGSSLATSGWTATTTILNKGDIFTIGSGATGVYMVNPVSYQKLGVLQQFRVVANTVTDGGGLSTIAIEPPIITSGPFQTVDASPAASAVITVLGATGTVSPQNLAFYKDAITLVSADLHMPRGADMAAVKHSDKVGVSMRLWRDGDIYKDSFPTRLDILYGVEVLRPEWGVRIMS